MKKTGLIFGVIVILVSNGIVLIGVSRNRSGGPVQTIELTERELPMQPREKDDSSISLRLTWRVRPSSPGRPLTPGEPAFDSAKLQELGVDCRLPADPSVGYRTLPRVVFIVLEYEGMAWEQWLKALEVEQVKARADRGTRLFVVDASRNIEQLRNKYPDPGKHLIVRAVASAVLEGGRDPKTGETKPFRWVGHVSHLLPSEVHVPLPYAQELARLAPDSGDAPRYSVMLHYGRNLEPWVGEVKLQAK